MMQLNSLWRYHRAIVSTLIVLFGAPAVKAQEGFDPMTAGRHYVLTYPDTAQNKRDPRYSAPKYEEKWLAFVYSPVDTRLRISTPSINRPAITITGGRTTVIDFKAMDFTVPQPMTIEPLCRPSRNTIRLDADDPVIVYCFMSTSFGGEAWTPLPVEAWGTEYFAAGFPGELVRDLTITGVRGVLTKRIAAGQIVVVSAYDGTRVFVASPGALATDCAGRDFTLNAGESVVIESYVDTLSDENQQSIAGARIVATNPVGVMSGNTRAQMLLDITSMTGNTPRNLLIEWLNPVEYHGKTFVYLPTWDSRRLTGIPGEKLAEKRSVELVRSYGTHGESTTGSISNGTENPTPYESPFPTGGVFQTRQIPTAGILHTTSNPAQLMMSAVPISVLRASTSNPWGWTGGEYDTWGGYMVELIPRERWTTFAPLYAPGSPAGLEHFVNIVIDSAHQNDVYLADGSRFIFPRRIAGTDLVWGSIALQAASGTWVSGRNGARFGGFVYGTYTVGGHEELRLGWRPEYEEWIGMAYGYPLAAPHIVVGITDTVRSETIDIGCGTQEIRLSVINESAAGLYRAELAEPVNTLLTLVSPSVLTGALTAVFRLEPIDRTKDASARLVVQNRTGQLTEYPFSFVAARATFGEGNATSFGTLTTAQSASRVLPVMNTGTIPIEITGISVGRNSAFTATPESSLPKTLLPGEALGVTLATKAPLTRGLHRDTITATLACGILLHPASMLVIAPSISVSDLDLGTVVPGATAMGRVLLRNTSSDTLTLNASPVDVIVSDNGLFTVSSATREKLAGLAIEPGLSVEIPVTFAGAAVGDYTAIAHARSNAIAGTGTSTWTIKVREISGIEGEAGAERLVAEIFPNPARSTVSIVCAATGPDPVRCELFDAQGQSRAAYSWAARDAGRRVEIDVRDFSSGIYLLRLTQGAGRVQRVLVIAR